MAKLRKDQLMKLGPGWHNDGHCLYLYVKNESSRSWVLRTHSNGQRVNVGIGGLDTTSIEMARVEASRLRSQARHGIDIVADRRAKREERRVQREAEAAEKAVPTFKEAAWEYYRTIDKTLDATHSHNWITSLELHVFPSIGKLKVNAITSKDIYKTFLLIWETKSDTAKRTLRRVQAVFEYCIAMQYSTMLPTIGVKKVLPKVKRISKNFQALPYSAVPEFITKLRASNNALNVKLSFEFLVLTAARTGEVLGARWEEINMQERTWTIPAARMKTGVEHRVALSERSIEILSMAKTFAGDSDLVFQGRYPGHELSNMSLLMCLRRLGYEGMTVHGMRACFKTWAEEQTNYKRGVIESALSHVVHGVEGDYFRGDHLDTRRELMKEWTTFALSKG